MVSKIYVQRHGGYACAHVHMTVTCKAQNERSFDDIQANKQDTWASL